MQERAAKGEGKGKTNGTLTQVLFTTDNTQYIIDQGAITRFPAFSHTNSAIFAGIFAPDENDITTSMIRYEHAPANAIIFSEPEKP